jgi:hypothetical protein
MSNQQGSQFGQGSHKDNPGSGQQGGQQGGQNPQRQQQQDPQKSGQQGNPPGQQGGGVATPKHGDTGRK